ncbi:MAG: hypothetical protein U5J83_13905 [Bryobacterales bacterium]|nr:hypothetical protein [Bryobacterales bacterium]
MRWALIRIEPAPGISGALLLKHRYNLGAYRKAEGRTQGNAHSYAHRNVAHGCADSGPNRRPKPGSHH